MPELNTTSTADISFMLLTFFLVTSSMDSDKGLARQLPPMPQEQQEETAVDVAKADILNVAIDGGNRLTCDGKTVTLKQLRSKVYAVAKAKPTTHVVSVKAEPTTTYDAYFRMQNAIVSAYNSLRNREAKRRYGHPYAQCNQTEKETIAKLVPQRISEAEPDEEKGGAK